MSYREENGQVILTMSRDDFERVLMRLGAARVSRKGCFDFARSPRGHHKANDSDSVSGTHQIGRLR